MAKKHSIKKMLAHLGGKRKHHGGRKRKRGGRRKSKR